jgi:hypothetical protein
MTLKFLPEEVDAMTDESLTDAQREQAIRYFKNRAAMRRHYEAERNGGGQVMLSRQAPPVAKAAPGLRVQLSTDGPVLMAPSAELADMPALDAWVRSNVPGADKLDPGQLRERSTAIRTALQSVGVKCSKRATGEPVLLLAAWPGGNDTERMLNMQRAAFPQLARTPLETQILLAREQFTRFQNRVV